MFRGSNRSQVLPETSIKMEEIFPSKVEDETSDASSNKTIGKPNQSPIIEGTAIIGKLGL